MVSEIEKLYKIYKENIERLKRLERELSNLDTEGFEEEVEEIKPLLKNPKAVEEVEEKINRLKKKIMEREETIGRYQGVEEIYQELLDKIVIPERIKILRKQINGMIRRREYENATKKIEEMRKLLNDLKNETLPAISPSISIDLLYDPLRERTTINRWKKLSLLVRNDGDTHAKNVKLSFSKELEVRGIRPFDLKAGQQKEIEVNIKPLESGEVPVEVRAEYERWDGKKYETSHVFTIFVSEQGSVKIQEEPVKLGIREKKPRIYYSFPPELLQYYENPILIGQGGFARVFRVKRKKDGKEVAVKVPISLDVSVGKSFIKELENWTKLRHENIVEVYDYNVLPIPYFEMELCDENLDDMEKPMEIERAAWITFNIAEGLKYAHKKGIVHRDLKPKNILLKKGIPKITDWGLSKLTAESRSSSIQAFSPSYAAPEHILPNRFGDKDERTDIWQLGVILYELVTGKLPFEGEDFIEVTHRIIEEDFVPPSELNEEAEKVEHIINRCLKKKREERYQSIDELQKDIAEVLNIEYKTQLKESLQEKNLSRSAYYCGELLLINMKVEEIHDAYKYATDLLRYSEGEIKETLEKLCKELKERIENNLGIPEELIEKAKLIVHKMRMKRLYGDEKHHEGIE